MNDMTQAPNTIKNDGAEQHSNNFNLLAGVSLRVSVEVGSTSMALSDLLALDEGAVIELDREASDLLDIFANGTLIARGEVVTIDNRYGIRIVEIAAAQRALPGFERRA